MPHLLQLYTSYLSETCIIVCTEPYVRLLQKETLNKKNREQNEIR